MPGSWKWEEGSFVMVIDTLFGISNIL